eukprot:2840887-Rhodomonas_salina.1
MRGRRREGGREGGKEGERASHECSLTHCLTERVDREKQEESAGLGRGSERTEGKGWWEEGEGGERTEDEEQRTGGAGKRELAQQ